MAVFQLFMIWVDVREYQQYQFCVESGIFSAADEAAERYLENRKRQADELCAEKEKETQERCMEVIRMIGERARKQEEETSGTPVESDGGDGPC